ncbi:MAG: ATP-grasp domain-containing protein [Sulfurimonas sp.]|nr:ATP-grasp domain-containing protein [Sulfurimonas sp.]
MKLLNTKVFFGPNPYALSPIVIYNFKIDKSTCLLAKEICLKIVNSFPKYFTTINLDNLEVKIYIGTVLSRLAKYLINNNGWVQNAGTKSLYEGLSIWVEFHHLQVTNQAIKIVLNVFQLLMRGNNLNDKNIQASVNSFNQFCKKFHFSTTPFLKIVRDNNIPMLTYLSNSNYWQFGWGKQSRVFMKSSSMEDSYNGVQHSMNKATSLEILRAIGVPTAKSTVINTAEQLKKAINLIKYPCVIKPIRGTQGNGITANIQNYDELLIAYKYAKESNFGRNPILVEAFIEGDDYRIMVANGKFCGAVKRKSSYVIGTGKLTLKELIHSLNERRANYELNPNKLKFIIIDDFLITHLTKQVISLEDIIEKDKIITLSNIANYSTGGIVEDVTALVHHQVKYMAELIAYTSGIATLGVDYITTDISKPYSMVFGAVTEYNHYPDLALVNFLPNPKNTLEKILNIGSGRIPLIIAVVNNSKFSQVQNWCKKNFQHQTTGWVCGESVYVGQLPLSLTTTNGWESVEMLLRNKRVENILIVCSDEQIMQKGLPVDKADFIYTHNIDLATEWNQVIQKSTSNVKDFDDIEDLLSSLKFYPF